MSEAERKSPEELMAQWEKFAGSLRHPKHKRSGTIRPKEKR